jgi:hypothetical protein
VTKPGNSDPAEPTADKAAEPEAEAAPTSEAAPAPEAEPAREATAAKPAEAAEATAEDKPEAEKSAEDKPTAAKSAKARRAAADPEPLMAELEKAPRPPREEVIRARAKRRFEEPPPRTLRFSFYFFTASGLVWLVSMVASLIFKNDIINAEIERNQNPDITPEQIANAVTQILWIVTIAALAFTVFLALFGYKATEGTRKARTLVTIFSTMLVIFHLLLNGTSLGILSALLSLIALALLWSRSARAYLPSRELP